MITLEDCIAFCGLTEEEVLAIAEHEHMPEAAACALAEYLLNQEHGPDKIRDMIVDECAGGADARGRQARAHPPARAASFPQGSSSGAAAPMGPRGSWQHRGTGRMKRTRERKRSRQIRVQRTPAV